MGGRLLLVPVGETDAAFLDALGERVLTEIPLRGSKIAAAIDPAPFFDAARKQVHSTPVLERLAEHGSPDEKDRVLGVADLDLFVPILTFVFGEAELAGRAAVFSTARLDPVFYGLPPDPGLRFERSVKEARHELGHTFGLIHCRHPDCVMRASTDAGDVDVKGAGYCGACEKKLGPDPLGSGPV
ncbi:MAG: archaemetzincin family Zn-dependent metalloprotease [Planctomycetota bacterium]